MAGVLKGKIEKNRWKISHQKGATKKATFIHRVNYYRETKTCPKTDVWTDHVGAWWIALLPQTSDWYARISRSYFPKPTFAAYFRLFLILDKNFWLYGMILLYVVFNRLYVTVRWNVMENGGGFLVTISGPDHVRYGLCVWSSTLHNKTVYYLFPCQPCIDKSSLQWLILLCWKFPNWKFNETSYPSLFRGPCDKIASHG